MAELVLEKLQYPLGQAVLTADLTPDKRAEFIQVIAALPESLKMAVYNLSDEKLDTPYRPEGWTVRQVVHHLADSHMNSYIRFRWALTEDEPEIKTYDERAWAMLPDAKSAPVDWSLDLLTAVHRRWVHLLEHMAEEDYKREINHPEWGMVNLDKMLCLYEWHCRHHTRHITSLRERMLWV
ncbi:MAG: YfiT family bacillithiol transferase [Bacteroidota bacterium]